MDKADRDLPWNDKPSKGGYQGNNLDAGNHQRSFQDMQAQARGEYSKRSASAGRSSPQFRSSAPRLQSADASSAHSHSHNVTPGPGQYSDQVTKSGQLSSYDQGTSGRGAGKGKSPTSSFASRTHQSLPANQKGKRVKRFID
jgi:hypothetical protein